MRFKSVLLSLALAGTVSGANAQEERALISPTSTTKSQSKEEPAAAKRAADKAEAWMKSWRSIEFVTEVRQKLANAEKLSGPAIDQFETRYIETALGQRLSDSRLLYADGSAGRTVVYCDGKRCATVEYANGSVTRQVQVSIKASFAAEDGLRLSLRPIPLKRFHVGLTPLHEALRKAEFVGEERALGRDCEIFVLRDIKVAVGNVIFRYSIDKASGVPLTVQAFKTDELYQKQIPYHTWTATKFEERQGHWCVVEAEEETFDTADPSNIRNLNSTVQSVKEISFDKDYPKSTFWPEIQPAVSVLDSFKGTQYVTPGEPIEEPQSGSPIRVETEADRTGLVAWLILGLGAAVLLTGLLLWKRRG